jgi:tetratricopeptide (TPR) repeat protein
LGILIGGPFVFSGATSNVLERLGDQFNAEQWYASPPVLNATACYRLALSFNPSNRTALHAMQDMATHLWSTARAYRERGDLKSAVQYLGWAVEITRNPDWERTYWQYQRQLKK